MLLAKTPALIWCAHRHGWVNQESADAVGDGWWFCTDGFEGLWDVPEHAETIWLKLYDKPSPSRYKLLRVWRGEYAQSFVELEYEEEGSMRQRLVEIDCTVFNAILHDHPEIMDGGEFYVGLSYLTRHPAQQIAMASLQCVSPG